MIRPPAGDVDDGGDESIGDHGGGPPPPPQAPMAVDPSQVKLEYVRKLISQIGQEGMDQAELMQRIERLLESGGGN